MVEKITQIKSVKEKGVTKAPPVKNVQSASTGEAPGGVKTLSVLYYIGAVLLVLFGITFIVMAIVGFDVSSLEIEATGYAANLLDYLDTLLIVFGIVFLGLAVLNFFIARGLKRGKNWTRIVITIFSGLGFIMEIVNLVGGEPSSFVGLAVYGVIIWYLWFRQSAKAFFRK